MSADTKPIINRRTFLAASLLSVGALAASPSSIFAAALPGDATGDRFTFSESNGTLTIVDNVTGETAIVVFDWDAKAATVTYSDGNVDQVFVDEQGNIYVNDELALEATQIPPIATRSVPAGFIPLLTRRYTIDAMKSQMEIIALIAGLMVSFGVYGISGNASLAASVLDLIATGVQYGYLEVKQYYNPNTYYVYTIATLYKNSNYTGVIWQGEFGPMPHT